MTIWPRIEIDAERNALRERQKQSFAALSGRDLENVAGAIVHKRDDAADRAPAASTASSPTRSS